MKKNGVHRFFLIYSQGSQSYDIVHKGDLTNGFISQTGDLMLVLTWL